MQDLSTGAQQVLDTLTEIGHGTTDEIRQQTRKSARVTDKAIRELTDAALIVETDPGDGTPARWSIAAPAVDATMDLATDTATDTISDAEPTAAIDVHQETTDEPGGELDPATATGNNEATDLGNSDSDATDPSPADASQLNLNKDHTTDADTVKGNPANDDPAAPADEEGSDDGSDPPADDADEVEQTLARPKPPADRRVLAVAGVLGDYPHGATIDEIAEATGYRHGAVSLLLQAMQQADAARRLAQDPETGTPEKWQPGPGKAIDVDPNPAPPRCPTCHQVIRSSTPKAAATAIVRSGVASTGTGTVNTDGNEPLGRGVLSAWTEQFINANPGHEFTPGTIAEALGAQHGRTISSGAVLNNCRTLAMNDQIRVVRQQPFTVTANKAATDSTADGTTGSTDISDSEQQ